MESNRESARRSRERKQKHLDDLVAQVSQLEKENKHVRATIHGTTQDFLNVQAENSVLRAQMMELTRRLESLDEILRNSRDGDNAASDGRRYGLFAGGEEDLKAASDGLPYGLSSGCGDDGQAAADSSDNDADVVQVGDEFMMNPWMNMFYHQNHPIMAAADAFQYYY